MHIVEKLINEARNLPFDSLRGRRIATIGKQFFGLSTCVFRRLLRGAGAEIDLYTTKKTGLIVVGEQPSQSSIIRILLSLSENSRPPFVKEDVFLVAFGHELRDLQVRPGISLVDHLKTFLDIGRTNNFGLDPS